MKPTLPELQRELQQLDAKRRQLRKAIKAAKPRKPVDPTERERAAKYVAFLSDSTFCWICGRGANERPSWWTSPYFGIERMHIVNKPRVEDVRVIVAGCSLCHRVQHGDRFPHFPFSGWEPESMEELLAIKMEFDPDNYDPEFIQRHSVRRLSFP